MLACVGLYRENSRQTSFWQCSKAQHVPRLNRGRSNDSYTGFKTSASPAARNFSASRLRLPGREGAIQPDPDSLRLSSKRPDASRTRYREQNWVAELRRNFGCLNRFFAVSVEVEVYGANIFYIGCPEGLCGMGRSFYRSGVGTS